MTVGVPNIENARCFPNICVQDGMIIPKINLQASASISCPHFKLAVSRMKRGGIEEIMISHIFLISSVWSVPLPPEWWHWCLHISFPLHHTFHTWSSKEALENILRNVWSFLLTHPRGVSPVWHWAGGRHLALCGAFSFSLAFWISSSRMVVAHLVCSAHTCT